MDRGIGLQLKLVFSVVCALAAAAVATVPVKFTVESGAFREGAAIPERFTCDGTDAMPPLRFGGLPAGTAEVALLVDDPDAPGGVFTHLLAWGLPPAAARLEGALPAGAHVGKNDFGGPGWKGPCPPRGKPHRYRFRVLALKAPLSLPDGSDRGAFDRAVAPVRLGEAVLVGTYERRKQVVGDFPHDAE